MTQVFDTVFQIFVLLGISVGGIIVVLWIYYKLKDREYKLLHKLEKKDHIIIKEKAAEVRLGKRWLMLLTQMLVFIGLPCLFAYKWLLVREAHHPSEGFWFTLLLAYCGVVVVGGFVSWVVLAYNRAQTQKGMETVTKYPDGTTKWHQWFVVNPIPLMRGHVDKEKIEDATLKEYLDALEKKEEDAAAFVVEGIRLYMTLVTTTQFDSDQAVLISHHIYEKAFQRRRGRTYSYSMPMMADLCRTKLTYMKKTTIINPVKGKNGEKYEIRNVPMYYCPYDDEDDANARQKFNAAIKDVKAKAILAAQIAAVDPSSYRLLDERETVIENADRKVREVQEREQRLVENVAMQVELAKKKRSRELPRPKKDYVWLLIIIFGVAATCLFLGSIFFGSPSTNGGGTTTGATEALRYGFS